MAVELLFGSALWVVGIPTSGYGLGGFLWDFHAPGRLSLCISLSLCGGYDHFVTSDAWVLGQPQYPDPSDLVLLGLVNSVIIGLLAFLVWTLLLTWFRRHSTGKAAA